MKISERAKRIAPSLTLEITAKANRLKADGEDVISFGAGEPDFNTPDFIVEAADVALKEGMTRYTPAAGTMTLRRAIAGKLERENGLRYAPEEIVVSNGAKHSLHNAIQVIVDPGEEVIIPAPYWLTYPELVKLADGVPVIVETKKENDFKITAAELEKAITKKTRAIILNSPNNPTGAVYSNEEFAALARVLEKYGDIYIISDEIYENLVYDGAETVSFALYSNEIKNRTILVNGVSKTFSMTGWRIGYTASNRELARAMSSMQSHMTSNPNSIAQYATEIAFNDIRGEQFVQSMQTQFGERRKLIIDELKKSETLSVVEPEGAFYCLVCVKSRFGKSADGVVIDSAKKFAETLLEKEKVAVIPCESFGAPDYIRLSYAISPRDIERGVKRLVRFADGLK